MKGLFSTAMSIRHSLDEVAEGDERVFSEIEAVITVSEKETKFSSGSVVITESLETIRFAMTPGQAREFSERLIEWADKADRQKERITVTAKDRNE